jgi:hypothetical protein
MTPIVPEHVARTKLTDGINNSRKENSSSRISRQQRSNSATLSTISVTCDTDTSTRLLHTRPQQSSIMQNTTTNSVLTNVSINSSSAFSNHQQDKTSMSTLSEMNITHEKSNIASSASTMSIPNKNLIKATTTTTGAGGGRLTSTKSLSIKHKSTSFDDHRSTREVGKSVLEQLVFVFPENVRRILAGSKK